MCRQQRIGARHPAAFGAVATGIRQRLDAHHRLGLLDDSGHHRQQVLQVEKVGELDDLVEESDVSAGRVGELYTCRRRAMLAW